MLKMSIEEIKDNIYLKEKDWRYFQDTNCYAFALGLDIPEKHICKSAYQPGTIYAKASNISPITLWKLSVFERLVLDLKTLGISIEEIKKYETPICQRFGDLRYLSWSVLMFLSSYDFHFARINSNGKLFDKMGYDELPKKTSIRKLEKKGYQLVKIFSLYFFKAIEPEENLTSYFQRQKITKQHVK
ncbi:MAG: hypothetical protein GX951_05295 [Mollicutes bacterium]|nr:hypothetical protein [Mollicutes bacterium]